MRAGALVLLMAFTAAAAGAQQSEPVPAEIVRQLDRLRADWPEVPQAQLRDGQRFEFHNRSIRVGVATLRDLASDPGNADGAVLTFLLAHEGWHAVQHVRRTSAEISLMKENRMLECEADFMGAAMAYRILAAQGLVPEAMARARRAIQAHIRARSTGFGGAAAYPDADLRATTIGIGWAQARSPDLFGNAEGRPAPAMAEDARAADVCARIGHGGDSSLGVVRLAWDNDRPLTEDANGRRIRHATFQNLSSRRVIVRLLAPSRYVRGNPGGESEARQDAEIYHVIDDSITLEGNQTVTRDYDLPRYAAAQADDFYWAETPSMYGGRPRMTMSRYAEGEAPVRYCFERIGQIPRAADRAMLARIAAIALAAEDDFRPVMGWEAYDTSYEFRQIALIPALNPAGVDMITASPSGSSVLARVLSHADAAVLRSEFDRVRALLSGLCGADAVVEDRNGGGRPGDLTFTIARFAPRAQVQLMLFNPRPEDQISARQGAIHFNIRRDTGG